MRNKIIGVNVENASYVSYFPTLHLNVFCQTLFHNRHPLHNSRTKKRVSIPLSAMGHMANGKSVLMQINVGPYIISYVSYLIIDKTGNNIAAYPTQHFRKTSPYFYHLRPAITFTEKIVYWYS